MGRNLILYFDGTNNQFGEQNTSVVRLIKVQRRDPERQLLFYDPGVGTLPEPGYVSALGKWFSKVAGLAFGAGLFGKVSDAYGYLMEHWRPGDRVFMFGFSRGSYTARVLAALLHMYGLLPSGNENLLPYLIRLLKASRWKLNTPAGAASYWKLCEEFRETFSRAIPDRGDRRFPVHFMGLFDTVSSVGWVWEPLRVPHTASNPCVSIVRHAVAIDERRCFFRQNLFVPAENQDLSELWFAGVHSDVGGGYPESEGGLWREAYTWMLDEAKQAGFLTDPDREQQVWSSSEIPPHPWIERQHESLRGSWWLAEIFPKLVYQHATDSRRLELGLGRHRRLPPGAEMHASVVRRLREMPDPGYKPPNLSPPGGNS